MSRLDRLVVLIDTGSTPFIRNTAADQLSDLAKAHPEEILNLITRVYPYLRSRKWETRTAAARAIGGIASYADIWNPNQDDEMDQDLKLEEIDSETKIKIEEEEKLKFAIMEKYSQDHQFATLDLWNLATIFKSGKKLLSNSENDIPIPVESKPIKKTKSDSVVSKSTNGNGSTIPEESSKSASPSPIDKGNARLKAMAKRKAKMVAKNGPSKSKTVDLSQSSVSRQLVNEDMKDLPSIKQEASSGEINITEQAHSNKIVVETKAPEVLSVLSEHAKVAGLVWPFQGIYELLVNDLLNERWEVRHGAVLGLRVIVNKHGQGVGRIKGRSKEENDLKNAQTLEDLCCRLLTLFAIDRFSDFVYDTVVAPVRESAAQALSALLKHIDDDLVIQVFHKLSDLVLQKDLHSDNRPRGIWEASHGGMLGLKYVVSVRHDILTTHPELLDDVLQMVLHGLKESDDDVQAVAAAALTPITTEFVQLKQAAISLILNTLWDCLTKLKDELSASIGSVMDLLSKLCIHPEVLKVIKEEAAENNEYSFKNLVPKLYPFLRHSIRNIRKSVLRTLLAFLSIPDSDTKDWIDGDSIRFIFQNLLLEQDEEILKLSQTVYSKLLNEIANNPGMDLDTILARHFSPMLHLMMTPIGVSRYNYTMNQSYLLKPSGSSTVCHEQIKIDDYSREPNEPGHFSVRGTKRKSPAKEFLTDIPVPDTELVNIDRPMIIGDITLLGIEVFYRTRIASCTAFGETLSFLNDETLSFLLPILNKQFNAPHSTPRLLVAIVVKEYCSAVIGRGILPSSVMVKAFTASFSEILADPTRMNPYRELVPTLKSVRAQCQALTSVFTGICKVDIDKAPEVPVLVLGEKTAGPNAFSLPIAETFATETFNKVMQTIQPLYRMNAKKDLDDARDRVLAAVKDAQIIKTQRDTAILSNFASAVVLLDELPKKLNSLVRSLMDGLKSETILDLQVRSALSVSDLVGKLIDSKKTVVSDKIVRNLCQLLCVDTLEVPEFQATIPVKDSILSLRKEESSFELNILEDAKIKRRGAKMALEFILKSFGQDVFLRIPQLDKIIFEPLTHSLSEPIFSVESTEIGQSIIDSLGILRALIPTLATELNDKIISTLPFICNALKSDYSVLRYSAAKVLAALAKKLPSKTVPFVIKEILPLMNNAGDVRDRQGGIEAVYHIASAMESDILPYVIFLIVPVLGRMSDADPDVRVLATTTFASIIKLVPLEAGIPDPVDISQELLEGREKEREFIQQMMDPSKSKAFTLPIAIEATLRKYQQDGVNWLAFLNKYHLHGILCDDMGLGKTLQTICIIASDHHLRAEDYKITNSVETRPLPSLIVCPPSLTGHWEQEFNQYSPFLKVLVYAGGPNIRQSLRKSFSNDVDIIVTSYDVVRNDVDFLSIKDYNYCVLDEGHIIKNAASKLTKSVKKIRANHRLILSGTPIQNNVLELWSLFDFLMPGFLGTEKTFQERFAKPIAASRNSKTSSKEQEAGALALEALHKQVLPFMLRRLKEEVLSDLPPKIIQDYYCQMGDLQKQLYTDFAKKQKNVVENDISTSEVDESKSHIFQALQYMRKLCNHPALVLSDAHPQYNDVQKYLTKTGMDIRDIRHAPKLMALKALLQECGIGVSSGDEKPNSLSTEDVISQHRALIFCQLKDMLDMVEEDLFRKHMPSVSFMRLDGTVDPRDRQSIVRKFNEDPSIDVLLLTTKVGGLGLNLTGADTVIFVEHDWNPMNDLQAMDRAHRLGQKKVVNVYRLITKDTLEEKIMGLQKFKMNIASTIVSQQNAGLASMDTNQILDLFDVEQSGQHESMVDEMREDETNSKQTNELINNDSGLTGKAGAMVGELGELWDQSQYDEEYNLDSFIKSMR